MMISIRLSRRETGGMSSPSSAASGASGSFMRSPLGREAEPLPVSALCDPPCLEIPGNHTIRVKLERDDWRNLPYGWLGVRTESDCVGARAARDRIATAENWERSERT